MSRLKRFHIPLRLATQSMYITLTTCNCINFLVLGVWSDLLTNFTNILVFEKMYKLLCLAFFGLVASSMGAAVSGEDAPANSELAPQDEGPEISEDDSSDEVAGKSYVHSATQHVVIQGVPE